MRTKKKTRVSEQKLLKPPAGRIRRHARFIDLIPSEQIPSVHNLFVGLWGFESFPDPIRAEPRQVRTERRRRQKAWLEARRTAMEDALEKLRLPRNSWRSVSVAAIRENEPDPFEQKLFFPSFGPLFRLIEIANHTPCEEKKEKQALEAVAQEAVWAAGIAWAADAALRTRDPELRFVFGRLLESFEVNRRYPKIAAKQIKRAWADYGKQGQIQHRRNRPLARIEDFVWREYQRLASSGLNKAARNIADNVQLQRIAKESGRDDPYPWDTIKKMIRRLRTKWGTSA